jgi:uncharacterized RDD family membrane protein YckC
VNVRHLLNRKRVLRLVQDDEPGLPPKASLFLRAGARAVDVGIALILYRATGPAGIIVALLYLLFADGMLQGQSLGKKLFGVKVIYLPTAQGARHRDSVLRNAPFAFVVVLRMMPELGPQAFVAGGVLALVIEAIRAWRDAHGLRLGDVWAQTQVVDARIPFDQPQLKGASSEPLRAPARSRDSLL